MRRLDTTAAVMIVALAVLAGWPSPAAGLVTGLEASVTAEVREFVGGIEGNLDSAFKDFGVTTENLPLTVEAELFYGLDGEDEAGATVMTVFYDPRVGADPDPDEFSLDVGTFSRAPGVGYLARSASTETRQITFLASEIGAGDGSDLEVRSQFFVDGLLLIWGDVGQTDLTGTSARVALNVERGGVGQAEGGTQVLGITFTLSGQSDGKVSVSASGPLGAENVTVLDLSDMTPDFGPLHLVIIPATTAIPYLYAARVGEPFELRAEIEAEARSQPMTGAAVQLGVPLLELAALIDAVTGETSGSFIQQFIALAVESAPPAAKPLLPAAETTAVKVVRRATPLNGLLAGPLCGLLGAESLLLCLSAWFVARSARRR